jgi:YjbE family integral membrane protein
MDLGWLGHITLDMAFFSALFSIVLIDLILSGDNSVVIAMAVRSLPQNKRIVSIAVGSAAAVGMRVILTFFAAHLLLIPFLKIVGGLLIAWIAVKLFLEGNAGKGVHREAASLMHAIKIICLADLIMSTDNVLAVAGASHGNLFLLVFGLGLSIPIVVGTSTLLSLLMDTYPVIIYIGSAVLGKVSGEMLATDPLMVKMFHPSHSLEYAVEASCAVAVVVAGKLLLWWRASRMDKTVPKSAGIEV